MALERRSVGVLSVLACALVALVSFRYLVRVGPVPPTIAHNALTAPWLVLHVAGAAMALLLCWVPNLLVAELLLRRARWASPRTAGAPGMATPPEQLA